MHNMQLYNIFLLIDSFTLGSISNRQRPQSKLADCLPISLLILHDVQKVYTAHFFANTFQFYNKIKSSFNSYEILNLLYGVYNLLLNRNISIDLFNFSKRWCYLK